MKRLILIQTMAIYKCKTSISSFPKHFLHNLTLLTWLFDTNQSDLILFLLTLPEQVCWSHIQGDTNAIQTSSKSCDPAWYVYFPSFTFFTFSNPPFLLNPRTSPPNHLLQKTKCAGFIPSCDISFCYCLIHLVPLDFFQKEWLI